MSNLSTSVRRQRDDVLKAAQKGEELNRYIADRDHNVCHLGARIQDLENMGYIFSVVRKPAYDLFGRLHPNIAHYTLKGFEAPSQVEVVK